MGLPIIRYYDNNSRNVRISHNIFDFSAKTQIQKECLSVCFCDYYVRCCVYVDLVYIIGKLKNAHLSTDCDSFEQMSLQGQYGYAYCVCRAMVINTCLLPESVTLSLGHWFCDGQLTTTVTGEEILKWQLCCLE